METNDLQKIASRIRRRIVELSHSARTPHLGSSLSCVDILTAAYCSILKIDPANPDDSNRDRFVLSKGHAALALYVTLCERGFFSESLLETYNTDGGRLAEHPGPGCAPGVEAATGSLGHGLPIGLGMALAAKIRREPYRVFVLMSDGECNEGSIWEAAQIASNLELDRITVVLDWNKKSSYGLMVGRNDIEPLRDKWEAFNWAVFECAGHDFASLSSALHEAEAVQDKPSIVLCHTVKGKGLPYVENYPVKPNILLSQEKYDECLAHLDEVENAVRNG
jgi:transketolase